MRDRLHAGQHRGAPGRAQGRAAGQGGATLIEVIVVLVVLVPVVLAATVGLLTTTRLSASTRTDQELESAASSFVETLKQVDYVECAEPEDYEGAPGSWTPPAGSGIGVRVESVAYWQQSSADYGPSCGASDPGAQLLTARVTRGEASTVLEVVKRDPLGRPGGAP
jgi:type II secretory pathway pseudopilin PulG